jgi:hypothetical protein
MYRLVTFKLYVCVDYACVCVSISAFFFFAIYDLLTFFAMFVSSFCLSCTVLVIMGRY